MGESFPHLLTSLAITVSSSSLTSAIATSTCLFHISNALFVNRKVWSNPCRCKKKCHPQGHGFLLIFNQLLSIPHFFQGTKPCSHKHTSNSFQCIFMQHF